MVADALSRPTAPVVLASPSEPVPWDQLAKEQSTCQDVQQLVKKKSLQLQKLVFNSDHVWCDLSSGVPRPLVPTCFRRLIFQHVHDLAHAGTRATRRMISARFVWAGLAANVKEWCRECTNCHKAKVTRQEKTTVQKIPVPEVKFSHVHVDLVGPWPSSPEGHKYLLTAIDRTTRWPEVCLLKGIGAEEVLDAFVSTWVARFGLPSTLTTDRGTQFCSSTWQHWCDRNNVLHVPTTAFHPQANGMVERFHRQLKEALKARGAGSAWSDHLPWVLLGIRAAPKDEAAISAAEAAFSQQLCVPGLLPLPSLPRAGGAPSHVIPATKRSYAEVVSGQPALETATWVYVRRGGPGSPLSDAYAGPYRVVKAGPKVFRLQMGEKIESVSRDRLKPHVAATDPSPAKPPQRGRPSGAGKRSSSPDPDPAS